MFRFALLLTALTACAGTESKDSVDGTPKADATAVLVDASPPDADPIDAPVMLTTVSGKVWSNDSGLSGATVTINRYPFSQVTTGSSGTFTVSVPVDSIFELKTTKSGYVGRQRTMKLNGSRSGLNVTLSSPAAWNSIASSLGLANLSSTKGIIGFDFTGAGGGESATIAVSHDPLYTTNSSDQWIISNSIVSGGGPFLFANNVSTGPASVSIISPPGKTCAPKYAVPTFAVDPNTVTTIEVDCN